MREGADVSKFGEMSPACAKLLISVSDASDIVPTICSKFQESSRKAGIVLELLEFFMPCWLCGAEHEPRIPSKFGRNSKSV